MLVSNLLSNAIRYGWTESTDVEKFIRLNYTGHTHTCTEIRRPRAHGSRALLSELSRADCIVDCIMGLSTHKSRAWAGNFCHIPTAVNCGDTLIAKRGGVHYCLFIRGV